MSRPEVELLEGEELLSTAEEVMFRQVTKHMFDGDKLATTAFGPATADAGMPSFSRSSLVSAQESRDWHTQNARTPSLGVWGVTAGEVIASGRYAVDDSGIPLPAGEKRAPGHCFVDYRGLSKREEREVRGQLYFFAVERGELPTTETSDDGHLF